MCTVTSLSMLLILYQKMITSLQKTQDCCPATKIDAQIETKREKETGHPLEIWKKEYLSSLMLKIHRNE